MKTKDLLKIKERIPVSVNEAEDTTTTPDNTATTDNFTIPGKAVIPKKKRYSYDIEEYDENQNFTRRDSTVEYTRDMVTADEIFNQIGIQDKKQSEEFFNIFPKIEAKDPVLVKEYYERGRENSKPFIIENKQNDYTLVNHDKYGTKFENNIEYDASNRRFVIEATDPEAFGIIQNINRGDRYKHSLRSKELQYILEFQSMTGAHCYIKMKNGKMMLRI